MNTQKTKKESESSSLEEEDYWANKYLRTEVLPEEGLQWCPGCGGGTALNAFVRALDALAIPPEEVVTVSGIGCSAWLPSPNLKTDVLHTTHGRAIAFATGVKIGLPDKHVVVLSGDGDLAGIGGNHLLHAARRNIGITVLLINNYTYGMTGGQVAATTLHGAKTTTSPYGNPEHPLNISGVVKEAGASYVARWTTAQPQELLEAIKNALTTEGFALVEIISQCPTVFGRRNKMPDPTDMLQWYLERIEKGELEVGEVVNRVREEFVDSLLKIQEEAQKCVK